MFHINDGALTLYTVPFHLSISVSSFSCSVQEGISSHGVHPVVSKICSLLLVCKCE